MSDFLKKIADFSPKRLLLLAAELEERVRELEQRNHAPIAIVGIGCRFPGGVHDADSFWELLRDGKDAISEVPRSRWNIDEFYDADPYATGKMSTRWGGFLDEPGMFDSSFFGIAPVEATGMDPQQRLLLEVSWEALEDAAIDPKTLDGSRTGVWIGLCNSDYAQRELQQSGTDINAYFAQGASHAVAAGRISYFLGLRGPSVAVDTACSSSLVAVHQACQSLRMLEVDVALAGGANLILSPEVTIALSRARMMSPDGRCKAFSADADGFVRSEGCGVVTLKRLDDATRDGDRVIAVIRGSAVNQDGRSGGLTAPNGPSQEDVIRTALADAGVAPGQIGYVEAHGTGTNLGDPIELRALQVMLADGRIESERLPVGSIKSNFGHAEAAAGIAGLIKLALALDRREIPASLHFSRPNPAIDWANNHLRIPTQLEPWREVVKGQLRAGSVSSFGFSGTNAHTVVSEAPAAGRSGNEARSAPAMPAMRVITLSARSQTALQSQAGRLAAALRKQPNLSLEDVAFTLAIGRSCFDYRAALRAESIVDLLDQLDMLSQRSLSVEAQPISQSYKGTSPTGRSRFVSGFTTRRPRVAFLFSGQGGERSGMGLSLLKNSRVFQEAIAEIDAALSTVLSLRIETIFRNEQVEFENSTFAQPALFAYQYGMFKMWQSYGMEPHVVVGHGIGEFMAAVVAGVLSVEDAARLVAARGRLTHELSSRGGMIAIAASEKQVESILLPYSAELGIAAINGAESLVISGRRAALERVAQEFEEQGLGTKWLATRYGFHSPAMDPVSNAFSGQAFSYQYRKPQVSLISGVTGNLINGVKAIDGSYFTEHLGKPVQFLKCLESLDQESCDLILEIGPTGTLTGFGEERATEDTRWISSSNGPEEEFDGMQLAMAKLFAQGVKLRWDFVYDDFGQMRRYKRLSLPSYPFERERYWIDEGIPCAPRENELNRNVVSMDTRLVPRFEQHGGETRLAALERTIQTQAANVLGLVDYKPLFLEKKLADLGMDSLMAIDLRNRLQAVTGLGLRPTFAFEYETVAQMAMAIDMLLWGAGVEATTPATVERDEIHI